MGRFATTSELRAIGQEADRILVLKEASVLQGKTIFLSHSSADHDILPGVIRILEGHGGRVYVDDTDTDMPQTDFVSKAGHIREVVRECRKLVLLVTVNTKNSRWIPWELGLGDGCNREVNVALFPASEGTEDDGWATQEYLGLYRRIIWSQFKGQDDYEWIVYDYRDNTGTALRVWLQQ